MNKDKGGVEFELTTDKSIRLDVLCQIKGTVPHSERNVNIC